MRVAVDRFSVMFFALLLLQTPSCARLPSGDHEKGREVSRIRLELDNSLAHRELRLLPGNIDFRFVIPEADCGRELDGVVLVEVLFANGKRLEQVVDLQKLTWPASDGVCRPVGYLKLEDGTRPLRIEIADSDSPVQVSVRVVDSNQAPREMRLWVVYNDRDPIDRMLN